MNIISSLFKQWAKKRLPIGRQITLNYNRVFILPTKAGIVFAAMLFVILLVGINYQNNLAYGLCFTLSSVMFLTIIHTCRNLSGISLTNAGAEPVFAEDIANFKIRLEITQGKHILRQAIGIRWAKTSETTDLQDMQLVDVGKLEGAELLLSKKAPKRGFFSPGKIYIETQFPLGLFVTWTELDLLLNVIVYPKPIEGTLSSLGHAGDDEEGLHSFGRGVDDFQGLRTYQPGDSKRLLNWKSFSKGQGLFVRDFTALAGKDPWLDYEYVEGNPEHRLSVLCYWVLKMAQEQRPYGFRLPTLELPPAVGDKQKNTALHALALYGISK